jgi:hypothetical protein
MPPAPAAIPAIIEVTFPAEFTPLSPACSANAITGTNPARDTKPSSSNNCVALAHTCGGFTSNAFCCPGRGFYVCHTARAPITRGSSTDRG